MGKIDKSELLEYFLAEAEDYLNVLSFGIPQLENASDRTPILEELFRAAHTLKGAAAIVKLTVTSRIAHSLEDILDAFKNKRLVVPKDTIELMLQMLDSIAQIVRDISAGKEEDESVVGKFTGPVQELLATLEEAAEVDEAPAEAFESKETPAEEPVSVVEAFEPKEVSAEIAQAAATAAEAAEPKKDELEYSFGNFIRLDLRKIEDMFNLIGEVTILKNHMLKKSKDAGNLSEEVLFAGKRLMEEVNRFAERHAYSISDNAKFVDPLFSEFGELEFDRYDEQNIFSRKVQELTEDIAEAMKELMGFYETFQDDIKTLDRVVNSLRSDLSESRMMDIGRLFQRFVRPVKEMAKEAGKRIEFRVAGQSTKIDRVIFEKLFDPLMHMIRNSIGHGIETSEERVSKGKKKEGTISLSARREGINIVIEIMDDGAGIDTGRILEEAIKQGLVAREAKLSREEILSLIFLHGFSTATETDMTSGRGVGMNAVRNQIANINGTVELHTEAGRGTTFRIRVPSSLAITNVIVFTYGNIEFVIPASLIEEVVQYEQPDELSETGAEASTINYRGTSILVKKVSEVFHAAGNGKGEKKENYVIVCSVSNKKLGLIVDDVFAQEEAIIKPVNRFLEGLSIYSGITISGDGKVRLVINPLKIFEEEAGAVVITAAEIESDEGRRVLVVDDSLSVRKYLTAFFTARNLKVFSASNGAEALKELDQNDVDLIVADLEMPVMHGYELVSRIRAIEKLRHIPIIVLTSRSAGKHKEKALELGADEYMVKPFEERTMEDALRKYALLQTA
jgi:chemotaxis protein histidine kinase CheA/ActR/RegA family two-component response regulator